MSNDILRRMHFREIALRYLDGFNPQPRTAIVIADAICSYDGSLSDVEPMRYQSHEFVTESVRVIDSGQSIREGRPFCNWLKKWVQEFGP